MCKQCICRRFVYQHACANGYITLLFDTLNMYARYKPKYKYNCSSAGSNCWIKVHLCHGLFYCTRHQHAFIIYFILACIYVFRQMCCLYIANQPLTWGYIFSLYIICFKYMVIRLKNMSLMYILQ